MHLSSFEQSVFLQSLGWAIGNSIWQGGILWILYKTITVCYNNASSNVKSNFSTAILITSFFWFIVTFLNRLDFLHNYLAANITAHEYTNTHLISKRIINGNFTAFFENILPYLSLAYLLLLFIFAIKLINAYCITGFIKVNGLYKPDAEWKLFVSKVANQMGIVKKINIWYSKYVDVPATVGFFKPVILIPLASLNQLTTDQMEAVILHEISHINRNDYLINLFVSLIETILFFNPFVVLLGKIVKKERENCCDDFVLQYQYDRHSYATALFVLEQSRVQQLRFALSATSGKQQLLSRIKRITEVKKTNNGLRYGQKLLALFISTLVICCIAWVIPEKKSNQYINKKSTLKTSPALLYGSTNVANTSIVNNKEGNEIQITRPKTFKEKPNVKSFIGSVAEAESNRRNEYMPNIKNKERKNKNSFPYSYNYETIKPEYPTQKYQLNTGSDNANFSKALLKLIQDQKILKEKYPDATVNELLAQINKGTKEIASLNWSAINNEIKEKIEKLKFPNFNIDIKNKAINIITQRKIIENHLNELQSKELENLKRAPLLNRSAKPNDSLITDIDPAKVFFDEAFTANIIAKLHPPELPPPPPVALRGTKAKILKQLVQKKLVNPDNYLSSTLPQVNLPSKAYTYININDDIVAINRNKATLVLVQKLMGEQTTKKQLRIHKNVIEL